MKKVLLLTEAKLRGEVETAFRLTANDNSFKPPPPELENLVVIHKPVNILFHLRYRELHSNTTVPAKDRVALALKDNLNTDWPKPASVDEQEVDNVLHQTEQTNQNCWSRVNWAHQLIK